MRAAHSFSTDMPHFDKFVIGTRGDNRAQTAFDENDFSGWFAGLDHNISQRQIDERHEWAQLGKYIGWNRLQQGVEDVGLVGRWHNILRREGEPALIPKPRRSKVIESLC